MRTGRSGREVRVLLRQAAHLCVTGPAISARADDTARGGREAREERERREGEEREGRWPWIVFVNHGMFLVSGITTGLILLAGTNLQPRSNTTCCAQCQV